MVEKKKLGKTKRKKIAFSIQADGAESVHVLGDFNEWNPRKHPMKKKKGNNWVTHLVLPQGRYEYKFLVDGQWVDDPKNDQVCENCFGTKNNVFNVVQK